MPMSCRAAVRRYAVSFALLVGSWLAASSARAEPNSLGGTRLAFVRTAEATDCIAAPALEREIVRRMRRDPFTGPVRQWIEAVVGRADNTYTVQLFERDLAGKTLGTRTLRSEAGDCHELDEAMVLAIALIIDPSAQLAPRAARASSESAPSSAGPTPIASSEPVLAPEPAPELAPEVRAPAAPASQCVSQPKAALPALPKAAPAAFVSADVVLVHGVLPGFAPGAELSSQLRLDRAGRYALRLSALFLPEVQASSALGEFSFGLSALEVGACRVAWDPRWRLFACAAFGVGAVHAVVQDLAPLQPGDRLWLALRAEVGAAVRVVGPLWFDARLFDLIALQRWEFRVRTENDGERAFKQSVLMPGLALGLGLHFD